MWSCIGACPCFDQCPSGCVDCNHPLCVCFDQERDEDFVFCRDYNELAFRKCTLECQHDNACFMQCNADFEEAIEQCPCNAGCPSGCPCEEWDCVYDSSTTTTTKVEQSTTTPTATTTPITIRDQTKLFFHSVSLIDPITDHGSDNNDAHDTDNSDNAE